MFDLRVISVMMYQLFDKTLPPLLFRHWSVIQVKCEISVNWYVFNFRNRPVQYGCTGSVVLVCMIAKHPRTAICSLVAVAWWLPDSWLDAAVLLEATSHCLSLADLHAMFELAYLLLKVWVSQIFLNSFFLKKSIMPTKAKFICSKNTIKTVILWSITTI